MGNGYGGIMPKHLLIVLLLSPYLVGFTPDSPDSSSTHVGIGAGAGSFSDVSRDCSGNALSVEEYHFSEQAISIDHYTPRLHLGLRAGSIPPDPAREIFKKRDSRYVFDDPTGSPGRVYYATPMVGLNDPGVGLALGALIPVRSENLVSPKVLFAGRLRVGRPDSWHFLMRLADDTPLMTGGPGIYNMGFEYPLGESGNALWLGIGGGPYDGVMFGSRFRLHVNRVMNVQLAGSFGAREQLEYGLSIRAGFVF